MKVRSILWLPALLIGCTSEGDGDLVHCNSGVRETFQNTVTTPTGSVTVDATQCVRAGWNFMQCEAGATEHCYYFFGPNQPSQAPPALIFGEFVSTVAVGHLEWSGPEILGGTASIRPAMEVALDAALSDGFFVSAISSYKLLGAHDAWAMNISCDHPEIDPICPYSWDYLFVDMSVDQPGVYVDLTAQYADYAPSNLPRPAVFAEYDEMIASIELTIE